MIINKIEPQGFCGGVKNAIDIAKKAIKDENNIKPIYLLGSLIHNEHVMRSLEDLGLILIDDKNKTRLELLDEIKSGSVIFSAHGVSDKVYLKAKEKNLNIIDATCPFVKIVHNNIKKYLNLGYDIIYIGTKGHPECEGVLGISDKINLITNKQDALNYQNDKDNIYLSTQTTLSIYEIDEIINILKNKIKNIIIDNKICNATTVRQEAIYNAKKTDLFIIVGDQKSSNTKKLYNIAKEKFNAIMINDKNDLDINLLKNINEISITSGASTPSYLVDEIIDYINKISG
ncbi:MAG: 4-hydroxy-3-methylbut-2-enyl diphosphate reductase [Acholeplasmatales bacterium]|nr:4-hydroxy-3-methylbut-2-enyl diphosphate reductase [Acholeplasmatales bacterium]